MSGIGWRFDPPPKPLKSITIRCDRCKQEVQGKTSETGSTCFGFYDVRAVASTIGGWERFANPGENYLCEPCMWTDERYIAVYGTTGKDLVEKALDKPADSC